MVAHALQFPDSCKAHQSDVASFNRSKAHLRNEESLLIKALVQVFGSCPEHVSDNGFSLTMMAKLPLQQPTNCLLVDSDAAWYLIDAQLVHHAFH